MVAQLRAVNESLEEKINDLKNKVFIVLNCYYIKIQIILFSFNLLFKTRSLT